MAPAALTASWKAVASEVGPPRSGPTAASDGTSVFLFGGYAEYQDGTRDVVDDVHKYSSEWQQLRHVARG